MRKLKRDQKKTQDSQRVNHPILTSENKICLLNMNNTFNEFFVGVNGFFLEVADEAVAVARTYEVGDEEEVGEDALSSENHPTHRK